MDVAPKSAAGPANRIEKVCGFDVTISAYMASDFVAIVDGRLMAGSVEAAQKILGRIVWTSPPCILGLDGTLTQIMTNEEWEAREARMRRELESLQRLIRRNA